eukprot:447592-Pleurochrysis_carterae.AAC.2
MLVVLRASRPAERMRAGAIPAEGTSGCKQGGGAASVDALLRLARECGERGRYGWKQQRDPARACACEINVVKPTADLTTTHAKCTHCTVC